jgi:hypothetical protein
MSSLAQQFASYMPSTVFNFPSLAQAPELIASFTRLPPSKLPVSTRGGGGACQADEEALKSLCMFVWFSRVGPGGRDWD